MHDGATVAEALELRKQGLNVCEISRRIGVNRRTIQDWVTGEPPHSFQRKLMVYGVPRQESETCPRCGWEHPVDRLSTAYIYLLGLYLGDGCISAHPRGVYRLRITLDTKYPGIIDECASAMLAVLPWNQPSQLLRRDGCVEVSSYSKSWPCLFPQHGPGMKHTRAIVLTAWQDEFVRLVPKLLLRGLIQSDGCRFINTGRAGWAWPRYTFYNHSNDIRRMFCDACDLLGLHWTKSGKYTIYVSRKADVARMDEFIGPKR